MLTGHPTYVPVYCHVQKDRTRRERERRKEKDGVLESFIREEQFIQNEKRENNENYHVTVKTRLTNGTHLTTAADKRTRSYECCVNKCLAKLEHCSTRFGMALIDNKANRNDI